MYPEININKQNLQNMSVDDSMRIYQDLLQQNLHLKQHIQRTKTQKCCSHTTLPSPSTAYKTTYLESPVYRSPVQQQYYSPMAQRDTDFNYFQKNMEYDMKQENEHYLEQLIEKNRYMEQKIDRLKSIHGKQHQDIDQIRRSRQWESRLDCKEDTCYEEKYMQLLRVRSPFY